MTNTRTSTEYATMLAMVSEFRLVHEHFVGRLSTFDLYIKRAELSQSLAEYLEFNNKLGIK